MSTTITHFNAEELAAALAGGLDPNTADPSPLLVQAVRGRRAELVGVLVDAGANPMGADDEGETAWAVASHWASAFGDDEAAVLRALGRAPLRCTRGVLTDLVVTRLEERHWTVPSEASREGVETDLPLGPVPLVLRALTHPTETFRWYESDASHYESPIEIDFSFDLMRDEYPEYTVILDGRPNDHTAIIGCYGPAPGLLLVDLVSALADPNPTFYRFDANNPDADILASADTLSWFLDLLVAAKGGDRWIDDL